MSGGKPANGALMSLEAVAAELGETPQTVAQIERSALWKLKLALLCRGITKETLPTLGVERSGDYCVVDCEDEIAW